MSRFLRTHPLSIQQIYPFTLRSCSHRILWRSCALNSISVRCASQSAQPEKSPQGTTPQGSREPPKVVLPQNRQAEASRKAALLLSCLSKNNKKKLVIEASSARQAPTTSSSRLKNTRAKSREAASPPKDTETQNFHTVDISPEEEAVQRRILENQCKILWPGIWTALALAGTFGTLAFLDVKYGDDSSDDPIQCPMRAQIPQTWYLTPTVIKEGVQAGWNELDKLTVGLLVASIGIHFMKKSPLPFWEKLIHITGEKKYTTFTYPFAHANWKHLGNNAIAMCWFLPGVVHYLDGDGFHAAALFIGAPLITSYLNHLRYFLNPASSISISLGSSGSVSAIFGAFCMAYPNEKVWWPEFLILRLDAQYWGALYVLREVVSLIKAPATSERSSFVVHVLSFGLGVAYVYFDGKENLWKPLKSRLLQRPSV